MIDWPVKQCPICSNDDFESVQKVKDYSISQEVFELKQCSKCHFIITADAPAPDAIGSYYESEDYISHSDKNEGLADRLYHAVRSYMLDKKRDLVEHYVSEKGHLLDYGSGTGYFLNNMQEAGWQCQGIEINASARTASQRNFGVNVGEPGLLDKLEDQSFDAITLWHVMEHIHDLNDLWSQLKRLLKPKGVLVVAVPNITSPDAKKYSDHWAALDVPRHLWHFKPADITALGVKHGFKLTACKGMPLDAFYVSLLSEKYLGNSMPLFGGFINGLKSNMKARSEDQKSSVIYILKHS